MNALPAYAELHCLSNFTFLRGASTADELFQRAQQLGYTALAITDECSFAGIVRAWQAASRVGVRLICGTEISLREPGQKRDEPPAGMKLVLLATTRHGYADLCRLVTKARRRSPKGHYDVHDDDLAGLGDDVRCLYVPDPANAIDGAGVQRDAALVASIFGARGRLAVELHRGADDAARLEALLVLAEATGLAPVAAGDVHMHVRSRRALQDTVTAIRLNTTIADAGDALFPNGERHLRHRRAIATLYPRELLDATVRLARECSFALDEMGYEYPHELVPAGLTPAEHLRALAYEGAHAKRWPHGIPARIAQQIEAELALIAELRYEAFFLTVHDIVRFARRRNILCQGRGSAANSTVCYCLGITEVNPGEHELLFERFMSRRRNEPPDIDVDFEHERREEVIQYVYEKYGRDRAALAATVISYQPKSAIRDVGKALGLSLDQVDALAKSLAWWDDTASFSERVRERGLDLEAPVMQRLIGLVDEVLEFPRHLSQHVGGFVISQHPIADMVPIENASMPDRTIIQWDKDDLEALCLLKVDCLALGMLTCLHRCFDLVRGLRREQWSIAAIPRDDPATYAMIQRADTLGVFQVESRAQMSMLPRLKPETFYDLVIQIAIVRPGPIQGGMVHPYLRRRAGSEKVTYPNPALIPVLGRTLGVAIFQEQVIRLAMVAANFTADEADDLRRSMAAWKRRGGLQKHEERLRAGMRANGYEEAYATQIFEQIKGFGSYGFPESHSASFALLAYASCWMKCHEPAAYACALLNSQPMGFYSPSQIIQDVRRHGVEVLPIDVCESGWLSTLQWIGDQPSRPIGEAVDATVHTLTEAVMEATTAGVTERMPTDRPPTITRAQPAIRLGLHLVRGFKQASAERIVAAREHAPYEDAQDLVHRAALEAADRDRLADAGALRTLVGNRHRARWAAQGAHEVPELFPALHIEDEATPLRIPTVLEDTVSDYAELGFTLGAHPISLVRAELTRRGIRSAAELAPVPAGSRVTAAGLVTVRQRPESASGTVFVTIEDETGVVNAIVWPGLVASQRRALLGSKILAIEGELQRTGPVLHLVAKELSDLSALLAPLSAEARNFH